VLLDAVGHTAVHVAARGDVVLVVDETVVEVDDKVEVFMLHPIAPTESTRSTAATPKRPSPTVSPYR